jgi:hypothetical protein
MKTTMIWLTCLTAAALIEAGCYTPPPPVAVQPYTPPGTISAPPVAQSPGVYVEAPPPLSPPPTGYAPDYYVWDGNEYVGVSNGQYVYWNGGVWLTAPPVVIGHFHGWQRYHPDWRRHAYGYHRERYR